MLAGELQCLMLGHRRGIVEVAALLANRPVLVTFLQMNIALPRVVGTLLFCMLVRIVRSLTVDLQ